MFSTKRTLMSLCFLALSLCNVCFRDRIARFESLKPLSQNFGHSVTKTKGIMGECNNSHTDEGRSYTNNSISIIDCSFSRIATFEGSGGVIYSGISSFTLNISESIFSNCSCTDSGGAIHFETSNSTSMRKICAYRCHSNKYEHFCKVEGTGAKDLSLTSVSYCSYVDQNAYSVTFGKGTLTMIYFNSSNNKANRQTGFYFSWIVSFTSSYGSFYNNTCPQEVCIEFCYGGGTMSYTNIVGNSSPAHGVINTNGCGATVSRCIFRNNTGTLFCAVYLSMTISNCVIFHSDNYRTSNPIIETNVTKNVITPTYDIQFFDSHYCGIFFENGITLKPTPQSPDATPYRSYGEATPDNTCNCNCSGDSSNQGTIDNVMTVTIYLIFLMILIIIALCISRCCRSNTGNKSDDNLKQEL